MTATGGKSLTYPEELPVLVRRRRLLLGWTQAQLGEVSGTSQSQVGRLETGQGVLRGTAERICQALLDNPPATAMADFIREEGALVAELETKSAEQAGRR